MQQQIEHFLDLLCCPATHAQLTSKGTELINQNNNSYHVTNGIPYFAMQGLSAESEKQEQHYAKVADAYQENLGYIHTKIYNAYLDQALDDVITKADLTTTAEICCGLGETFSLYTSKIQRGVGLDISGVMLQKALARDHGDHILFVQGDALNLPLQTESFSTVIMLGGIHHIPNKELLYKEFFRILKPGGSFIAREPVDDFFLWRWLRAIIYKFSPALDEDTEKPLRYAEDTTLIRQAGFIIDTWATYGFLGYCFFMNSDVLKINKYFKSVPGIATIVKAATTLDAVCLRLPFLKLAGTQVIFRAVKEKH